MLTYRSVAIRFVAAMAPILYLHGADSLRAAAEESDRVQAGQFTFVFATQEQGHAVLGVRDRYTSAMSPFDRQVRMRTDEDPGEQAFLDFTAAAVKPWSTEARETFAVAIEKIKPALSRIKASGTSEVLLVRTDGKQESGAAYTRGSAIVLPAGDAMAAVRRDSLIAHELFHVISRNDSELRDELYKQIGFRRSGTISLPGELAGLKLTNPDAPEINHVIDLKVAEDQTITVAPVLYAKGPFDPRDARSLFGYLEFRLMEVTEIVGKRYVAKLLEGKPVMHQPNIPDFHRQIGRNTKYIIHPEEILADNFALLITENQSVADKWLVEAIRAAMVDGSDAVE